jgi:DNA repair photolyase
MKRWGKQSPLHFDEKEMKTDLGKGNFIFVGSSCDMFAENTCRQWIREILCRCGQYDNAYLFQTRNISRLYDFGFYGQFPPKSVFATTIETNRSSADKFTKAPPVFERYSLLKEYRLNRLFISVEPIMDFDLPEFLKMIKEVNPEQVNIGADSSHNGLPEPPKEKLLALIAELEKFTTVVKKKNLGRLLK